MGGEAMKEDHSNTVDGAVTERRSMGDALAQAKPLIRTLIDNLPDRIYVKDADSRIVLGNLAYARALGADDPEEIVGKTDFDFRPQEVATKYRADELAIMESGTPLINQEQMHTDQTGIQRWVLATKAPWRDSQGKIVGIVGISRDITEIKQTQAELQRYAAELERSNQDLQQFAYVASHDLQEPLRMVASYTNLLARRYQDQLDKTAAEFMGFIVDATSRMQALVQDLLAYARVETQAQPLVPTALEAALTQALTNLQVGIRERGATITHDPLPSVMADERQLVQLFQNLIGNAIKFCKDKSPEVHVSAEPRTDDWVVSVRDNGIGLEPQYAEKIFQIFQRLHGKGEYPGTGIGLAICKKIVERHGGRIWVESAAGQGATFSFTLKSESAGKNL
jgi:PAS domain S-box-containing protein